MPKFERVFLIVILMENAAGLKLCDASNKYLEVEEGKESNVFTCSELGSDVKVYWALDDVNTVLGTCPPPPDLRCDATLYTTIFSLSRSAADTASIAVNAKAALTKDIFWTTDLVCQSFSTANKKLAETRCSFDYISPPKSPACSLQFSASPWAVTGQCSAADVFSKRERYYCLLYQTNLRIPSTKQFVGRFNMSTTSTSGTNYFSATCQISTFLPPEGSYSYSIVLFPGQVQILPSLSGSTEIRLPRQSPNHTCPHTVREDSALECICIASDLGKPQGFITWKESGSPELNLDKVSRTLNGMTYTCSLMWNNTYVQAVTYTLSVHYPPTVVRFQMNNESKTVNVVENSSVPVVCGADGRPPPTVRLLRKYGGGQDTELMTIVSNTQTLQYNMNRVQCDTAGAYVCRSENAVGDNEQTIQLTVSCAPRENPANVHDSLTTEFNREEATLQFHMVAYPQPELLSICYIGSFSNDTGPKTALSGSLVQSSCSSQKLYISTCTVTLRKKENFTFGFYSAVFGNTRGNHSFIFETSNTRPLPLDDKSFGGGDRGNTSVDEVPVGIERHKNFTNSTRTQKENSERYVLVGCPCCP